MVGWGKNVGEELLLIYDDDSGEDDSGDYGFTAEIMHLVLYWFPATTVLVRKISRAPRATILALK